tara:strand:- start:160 stop:1056 length:897 start_codon:yes stop_codon:yes gene_type:complete
MGLILKYIVFACVTGLYYAVSPSPLVYNTICLALILVFGIPHGAADHRINSTIDENSKLSSYIIKYVLIATGYVVWWIFMPGKALIAFFILSSYHFGQEFLEEIKVSTSKVWEIMIWGSAILIAPIIISYNEIRPNLEFVSKTGLPEVANIVLIGLTSILMGIAAIHSFLLFRKNRIDASQLRRQIYLLITLVISFSMLPFIIAFTLYFILFHSLNAFKHQFQWLQSKFIRYTIKSLIGDLLLFSLFSIFGILAFIFTIQPENWSNLISYFFILISVITLPHSILFDQFYKFKRSKEL